MKNLSVNALLPILLAVAACAEKNGTVPETPEDTSWIAVETYVMFAQIIALHLL